jgi:hypothetical protein
MISRFAAFGCPEFAKGYGSGILTRIRILQWTSVHLLPDGLFHYAAGICKKIAPFACSTRHSQSCHEFRADR